MTALSYIVTTTKGTYEVKTWAEAKALVAEYGGSFRVKYTKVEAKVVEGA